MSKVPDFNDLHNAGSMPADVLELADVAADDGPAPAGPLAEAPPDASQEAPQGKAKGKGKGTPEGRPSQAEELLQLAAAAHLFHTADGCGYADVQVNGHRETHKLPHGMGNWLRRAYFKATGTAPAPEALSSALAVLQSRAEFDGPECEVYLRAAPDDARLYIDLADPAWQAVEVDADGWRVVQAPPVRFRRPKAMQALPIPKQGGSVERLRTFVNVSTDDDWILLVAWILATLRGRGPFPVLVLIGEQGTAKSTLTRILRALSDPGKAAERPLPGDDRDMAVAAENAYVLAFGNLSGLAAGKSDALCRLSTGGGFATRELYADRSEAVFDAMRPIILNGIDEFVNRPDLGDRAILLHLEPILAEKRQSEADLWAAFDAARPEILGALLDAVAVGFATLPGLSPVPLPRMADFANWGRACERAYAAPGAFMRAYQGNRAGMVDATLDGDPVAAGVRKLAQQPGGWEGTATELLAALQEFYGDARGVALPKTAKALSDRVRRLATFLRVGGVHVELGARVGKARTRTIRVWADLAAVEG